MKSNFLIAAAIVTTVSCAIYLANRPAKPTIPSSKPAVTGSNTAPSSGVSNLRNDANGANNAAQPESTTVAVVEATGSDVGAARGAQIASTHLETKLRTRISQESPSTVMKFDAQPASGQQTGQVNYVPAGSFVPPPLAFANHGTPEINPRLPLPAAFFDPGVNSDATNGTSSGVGAIRQAFLDAIGGENENPDDPAYWQRWKTAQWLADQQYYALYGQEAFQLRQSEAAAEAITPPHN